MIDFSCKHNVLIQNPDGTLQPMDEPYFEAKKIAPGTWQILSDGDYSYLVEGENEALVIDSGYGCGDLRAFCQTLTDKTVRFIANTHDHFDHTANNCYFECAFMSAKTRELATIPFPSFEGIHFPRNYPVQVIEEGFVFDLGGRTLEAFSIPNHAAGSLAFLDRKERILFSGDEFIGKDVFLQISAEQFAEHLDKLLAHKDEFDRLCAGPGVFGTDILIPMMKTTEYILQGHEGKPTVMQWGPQEEASSVDRQTTVYIRGQGHAEDFPTIGTSDDPNAKFLREITFAGCTIIYDMRKVRKEKGD